LLRELPDQGVLQGAVDGTVVRLDGRCSGQAGRDRKYEKHTTFEVLVDRLAV